jgi:thioredoxin reductase (NADPH)
MREYNYDVIILGGGPAGFSAGLYCARGALKTAIIDISMLGGQPSNYLEIENYLGFKKIGGYDLTEKFEQHLDMFGADKFPMQEILSVDLVSTPKVIKTKDGLFKSASVIIATGASPMKLGIKGEEEFLGRGVSYCAVCDGSFYQDKVVAVVGGGNSAVEEAIYLTNFASKVYIIHRRDELRADKIIQQRAFNNQKIEFVWNSVAEEIRGEDLVKSILIKNTKTGDISELNTDGVFPYIGIIPNVNYITGQLAQDSRGFIQTDLTMKTSLDGVYAVGDVRNTPLRQVITAVSDGAVAGVYCAKYVQAQKEVTV